MSGWKGSKASADVKYAAVSAARSTGAVCTELPCTSHAEVSLDNGLDGPSSLSRIIPIWSPSTCWARAFILESHHKRSSWKLPGCFQLFKDFRFQLSKFLWATVLVLLGELLAALQRIACFRRLSTSLSFECIYT